MAAYRHPAIKQLKDQLVGFTPREVRIAQIDRAENLYAEVGSEREYPYQYVCYRITEFRPSKYPDLMLGGEDLRHDLRLFVEDISDSVDLTTDEADEFVLTPEELGRQYNVSTKTVLRWRHRGLMGRRFVFDGRKRIGFLKSSVERFVEKHRDVVRRGSSFSQLSESEKDEIVRRARRLARVGGCPSEVAKRVAHKMGRSPETIRYTLKNHDRDCPKHAIFPEATGPLDSLAQEKLYSQYRRGVAVDVLAKRYCRTRTSIYRVISEVRARRLLARPLDCMHHESFDRRGVEREILGPYSESSEPRRRSRPPQGLHPYLAGLNEVPLLSREQEAYLFRKMNFLKYKASKLREGLNPKRAKSNLMDKIESLVEEALAVKNQIIRANLRLVVSIAKRHVGPMNSFFELVSDGNMSLIRAVEKFDYSRGNKFSTYATWAIMKNFARSIPVEKHRRDRFRTGNEEMFEAAPDNRSDEFEQEAGLKLMRQAIGKILERLDDRERQIIISRFGLQHEHEPQTLQQVGIHFGVTKERIRQLEARALNKLRRFAQEEKVEVPGD